MLELDLKNYENAKLYGNKGLVLAKEIRDPHLISRNCELLSMVAKNTGNWKESLEMYELFIQMRDSLKNQETQKAAIRQQTKYEFEKAQLFKEQEEKERARQLAEAVDRRDSLQYSVILIIILVLLSFVFALGKIRVSAQFAEGIIFFSFLILFEFLLVLADPYIDNWTGGAAPRIFGNIQIGGPGWKLLINAGIAAGIFPLHAFFEKTLKKKLVK